MTAKKLAWARNFLLATAVAAPLLLAAAVIAGVVVGARPLIIGMAAAAFVWSVAFFFVLGWAFRVAMMTLMKRIETLSLQNVALDLKAKYCESVILHLGAIFEAAQRGDIEAVKRLAAEIGATVETAPASEPEPPDPDVPLNGDPTKKKKPN
jgi:hypothetical protein